MMKLNKKWHLQHPRPKNPSFEQRVEWHLEHQKNCLCRPMPEKLAEEMKKNDLNN